MPKLCLVRHPLLVVAVISMLVCLSASAYAVDMELQAGFDNSTKSAVWTPISVRLTNPGGRTVEGVLDVKQDVPNRRVMPICAAKVSLPANSTKLYHVYTRRQEYGGNIKVSLLHGSRTIASREIQPITSYRHDRMIVTIGDRASKLSFLSGERLPLTSSAKAAAAGQTESTIQAAALSPLMLPDRPAAYQAIDVMVMSDIGAASVDPKALKAISMWVAGGGTLVVSAGPNFRNFKTEFFDEMLPVTITGAGSVQTLSTLGSMGQTAFAGGPVAVATSTPKPGIAQGVLSESGIPIYAERGYGAGGVVFLAFDYRASPFRDWNGQTGFWKRILNRSSARVLVEENSEWWQLGSGYGGHPYGSMATSAGLTGVVEQNPAVKTPSFNVIALYLLAYLVCLVPLNYLYLKKKRRMELAWISTPVIVLAFTFGAYAIGYTMKGGRIEMGVATVIEGSSNSRYARTISDASVFSPSKRSYDIVIKDPYAIGQIIPQENSERMQTAYVGAEQSVFQDVDMAMWSSKAVESVSGIDLGGVITSKLAYTGSDISGSVTNNTQFDLKDCRIQYGGNQQWVGNLPKGRTVNISRPSNSGTPPVGGQSKGYANELRSRLDTLALTLSSGSMSPVLVAFTERDAPYGLAGGNAKITSMTCCMFRLDVNVGGARGIFPQSAVRGTVGTTQNARPAPPAPGTAPTDATMVLSPGGYFLTSFQMPDAGSVELVSFSVRGKSGYSYHGSGQPQVQYYLVTSSGSWEPIPAQAGPIGNPAKYLRPGNRIVVKAQSADSQEITVSVGVTAVWKRK